MIRKHASKPTSFFYRPLNIGKVNACVRLALQRYYSKGFIAFLFPVHSSNTTRIFLHLWLVLLVQLPPSLPLRPPCRHRLAQCMPLLFYLEHSNRILVSIYLQMCVAVTHIKLNGLRISNSLNDCCLQNALPFYACVCVYNGICDRKIVTAQKRCRNNNFYNYICRFIYMCVNRPTNKRLISDCSC